MITAELNEIDREGKKLDYVAYNRMLEETIRKKFEDDKFEIQIIGFAKQIGDIADGAAGVLDFCGIALLLTAWRSTGTAAPYRFTLLPIACSLTSLVWQFGTLRLLGYGLDPLAVLVPFLVFAIGVSHGVQQINFIVRGLAHGKTHRGGGAGELHRPPDPRHAGAGHRVRLVHHAGADPDPDGARAGRSPRRSAWPTRSSPTW